MKRVLIFVLSATIPPYRAMICTSLDTWDQLYSHGVQSVFYTGNPPCHEIGEHKLISFPVDESYATIGHKNLAAYRHALELKWDYMARVNASCYVHKRRLRNYCQSLPETNLMRGVVSDPHEFCGSKRPFMWGGGQYIFSRDVIEAFVANGAQWNHSVMEDVAMSELAHDLGIPLDNTGRMCSVQKKGDGWTALRYNSDGVAGDFATFKEMAEALDDQFFFRVKHDGDRDSDAEAMRLLKQYLPV